MADYAVRADVEKMYGKLNVERWADLDSNKFVADIDARIVAVITQARNWIDARLTLGPYDVSTFTSSEPILNRLNSMLAGVFLYENRGINDFDPESGRVVHRLGWQRKEVGKIVNEILAGKIKLISTRVIKAQTSPHVV